MQLNPCKHESKTRPLLHRSGSVPRDPLPGREVWRCPLRVHETRERHAALRLRRTHERAPHQFAAEVLGGEDIESAELGFPIEVCDGCLVSYSATDRDLTSDSADYQCKLATDMASGGSDIDLPCQIGIDLPVPCTVCSGTSNVCVSPKNNPYYQ